jgi:hypothetical protein
MSATSADWAAELGLPVQLMSKVPNWQILAIYSIDFIGRAVWTEQGKLTVENSNEITRLFLKRDYLHEMYEEADWSGNSRTLRIRICFDGSTS